MPRDGDDAQAEVGLLGPDDAHARDAATALAEHAPAVDVHGGPHDPAVLLREYERQPLGRAATGPPVDG
jgi:hypothetical protein